MQVDAPCVLNSPSLRASIQPYLSAVRVHSKVCPQQSLLTFPNKFCHISQEKYHSFLVIYFSLILHCKLPSVKADGASEYEKKIILSLPAVHYACSCESRHMLGGKKRSKASFRLTLSLWKQDLYSLCELKNRGHTHTPFL